MPTRNDSIDLSLGRLGRALDCAAISPSMKPAIERWRSDAAALKFHLRPRDQAKPMLLAVIGGTGTGKSTLVNRLLGVVVSATNFRRTFTSGIVAVARDTADVPDGWLGVERSAVGADRLPARGNNGSLLIVAGTALGVLMQADSLLGAAVIADTPDLDGDQRAHHAEADRAFRWAQALVFLVTPEKYQMTELLPYYRLAARYAIPARFVMNKCEEQAVVEDYRKQLAGYFRSDSPQVFVIPRDDSTYQPPAGEDLASLRESIIRLSAEPYDSAPGAQFRAADLLSRFKDQILDPLRIHRKEADRLVEALRDMETPALGVDVNPVTQDLERRLQQRSVLYLMGPQRVLERVRHAPAMLVRLPRAAWDYVMRGEASAASFFPGDGGKSREVPDFKAVLTDQFSVLQSRIDDVLGASPVAQKWIGAGDEAYASSRIAPADAGRIAEEELAELRNWLEKRWNATPWDTRALQSLLKYLPGGKKLTSMTEAAPYLLAIGLIAHHALFGTDLLVLGGYTLATWLTERLSNEVAVHTRTANSRIADRFTRLAHEQIQKTCAWIQKQAVSSANLEQLDRAGNELAKAAGCESET
ncbi:MAG TPA: GTPase domain-containing protein [Tepidisphaeraceae bacterium]|jgi:energy-coupling factor transporter ATP-binding protein EcfA2|nr:GTPase domain-containing protein [Tepidisphaeraceae bacterium]